LKSVTNGLTEAGVLAALCTRAWVEIGLTDSICIINYAALCTRAWVEIRYVHRFDLSRFAALCTRAWVEMGGNAGVFQPLISRPLHEGVG